MIPTSYENNNALTDIPATELIGLYHQIKLECKRRKLSIPPAKTTKRRSYDHLNIPDLDLSVLQYVYSHPNVSRKMISDGMKKRLSSICGGVNRLLEQKLLLVSGECRDAESNQTVELLTVNVLWGV